MNAITTRTINAEIEKIKADIRKRVGKGIWASYDSAYGYYVGWTDDPRKEEPESWEDAEEEDAEDFAKHLHGKGDDEPSDVCFVHPDDAVILVEAGVDLDGIFRYEKEKLEELEEELEDAEEHAEEEED